MMLIIHFCFTLHKKNEITALHNKFNVLYLNPNSYQDTVPPHSISPQPLK